MIESIKNPGRGSFESANSQSFDLKLRFITYPGERFTEKIISSMYVDKVVGHWHEVITFV